MPAVLFKCPRCSRLFGEGGIHIEGDASQITLMDNRMSCPDCGTMSPQFLPGGTYDIRDGRFVRSVVQAVVEAGRSVSELEELRHLISQVGEDAAAARAAAERVDALLPGLRVSIDEAKQRPDRLGSLLSLIGIVLSVLQMMGIGADPVTADQVQRIVDDAVERIREQRTDVPQKPPVVIAKVGRNDPCPCGSGSKFKHCHGTPARRAE